MKSITEEVKNDIAMTKIKIAIIKSIFASIRSKKYEVFRKSDKIFNEYCKSPGYPLSFPDDRDDELYKDRYDLCTLEEFERLQKGNPYFTHLNNCEDFLQTKYRKMEYAITCYEAHLKVTLKWNGLNEAEQKNNRIKRGELRTKYNTISRFYIVPDNSGIK